MFTTSILLFVQLAVLALAAPTSNLESRQNGITVLSAAEVASFKPYTNYAGAAYCDPKTTKVWNCGG